MVSVSESDRAKQLEKVIEELKKAENYYVLIIDDIQNKEFSCFVTIKLDTTLNIIKKLSKKTAYLWGKIEDAIPKYSEADEKT